RPCDFVYFVPETLGFSFQGNERRLSVPAFNFALLHVVGVLMASGKYLEALPLLSTLEHLAVKVTLEPIHVVRARLQRVQCLAEAGFPAEAASILSSVLRGGELPGTVGGYAGFSRPSTESSELVEDTAPPAADPKGKGDSKKRGAKGAKTSSVKKKEEASKSEETPSSSGGPSPEDLKAFSLEGLPFFGLAPYHNHLPLDHIKNSPAIAWLIGERGQEESKEGGGAVVEAPTVGAGTESGEGGSRGGSGEDREDVKRACTLLCSGLSHLHPTQLEVLGEEEVLLVAMARAKILVSLARCCGALCRITGTTTPGSASSAGGGKEESALGGEAVVRKIRDSADLMLGEILQVVISRVVAQPTPLPPENGDPSEGSPRHSVEHSSSSEAPTDGSHVPAEAWVVRTAVEALLLRGRLALQDGKLRVCRHHDSRALAVILRHGLDLQSMVSKKVATAGTSESAIPRLGCLSTSTMASGNGSSVGTGDLHLDANEPGLVPGTIPLVKPGKAPLVATVRVVGLPALADPEDQPWKMTWLWLELRHDLTAIALFQGRTADAIVQCQRGLAEAEAVGEAVILGRLRRLRAQVGI
ncbi:unnamed protein product, partial [Discosporangium mesarthrocarpum]